MADEYHAEIYLFYHLAYINHTKNLSGASDTISLFFDHLDFQKIKINGIHKAVLVESRFGMPFEFVDIDIQPDWFAEIKFIAYLIQSIENLVGSGIVAVITDGGIFDHTVVFKFFSP